LHDFCQSVTVAFCQQTHVSHDHHPRGPCYSSASIAYDAPCMGAISYQEIFASALNGTIRKLIRIILQGIDIAKASRGEETFNRLAILGDHQMNLQSIKIPFLAGLIASKIFMGVYL